MTTETNLSRRRLLASMPAAAATMAPVAATALSSRSSEDPVFAALASHKAAYAEIAAISNEPWDESKESGEDIDQRMSDALWRSDAKLKVLLNTMPTTIFGLACVLQHLATHQNNDPSQSNILVGACDAGDPDLSEAAENYLARLSAAVFAMNGRSTS